MKVFQASPEDLFVHQFNRRTRTHRCTHGVLVYIKNILVQTGSDAHGVKIEKILLFQRQKQNIYDFDICRMASVSLVRALTHSHTIPVCPCLARARIRKCTHTCIHTHTFTHKRTLVKDASLAFWPCFFP